MAATKVETIMAMVRAVASALAPISQVQFHIKSRW